MTGAVVYISHFILQILQFLGAVLLDHEGRDLTNVLSSIVEKLTSIGYLDDENASELLRVLLFRHKYVNSKGFKWSGGLNRQQSSTSIIVKIFLNCKTGLYQVQICQ
jgi:hypothetical protein